MKQRVLTAITPALLESMSIVRAGQKNRAYAHVRHKTDGTLVTETDEASESVCLTVLRTKLPGTSIVSEERGTVIVSGLDECIYIDPLDGTRALVSGMMTSTVIIALYDKRRGRVTCCMVGEPATNRVWQAVEGSGARTFFYPSSIPDHVHVWDGQMDASATVFLDLYPGFAGKGYQALGVSEQRVLLASLHGRHAAVAMAGSNGLHHALVANGGNGVAGAITTAYGGPWDVAAVLCVLEAGGVARAFSVASSGKFLEHDPLAITDYRFLVTGNSKRTVDILSEELLSLRR